MSIIKVIPTNQPHTRLLNDDTKNISNNAYVVYGRLCDLHPDFNPTNEAMQKISKLSEKTYKNAKRELLDNGLLYVQRTGGKGANIIYHVGSMAVKRIRKKLNKTIDEGL